MYQTTIQRIQGYVNQSAGASDSGFMTDCVADVTAMACLPDDVVDFAAADDNNSDCDCSNDDYRAELDDTIYMKLLQNRGVLGRSGSGQMRHLSNLARCYQSYLVTPTSRSCTAFFVAGFSASAERALNKFKIVKNQLRSSLCDDMLSALLVLASCLRKTC
jgi:hypothetical protein